MSPVGITLALAIGVVMMWNFFINRYWTYNDVAISNVTMSKSQEL